MAEQVLTRRTVWEGQALPKIAAGSELTQILPRPLLSVAAFPGQVSAAQDAARDVLGATLPDPGRWVAPGTAELAAAELDTWFCWGGAEALERLKAAMAGKAATVDQSSGWVGLNLTGSAARDVLARVTPLDLRAQSFRPGSAARTEVAHMAALLLARDGAYDIWVMRSFARTLLHDLWDAMNSVGAQRT